MRSKLFVPASRPELFAKAVASEADALSFDLEDAVAEPRKNEARTLLRGFLQSAQAQGHGKTLIVRVNAMDTPHFAADIAAVVRPGLHLVNLPKPDSPEAVAEAAALVAEAARANGVQEPPRLLLNIETPKALRTAAALACAHPLVAGLQLGLGDLFEPYGVHRREPSALQQALFAVRMAAAEAGVFAYDGAFADIRDTEGFRAEAELSRRLGFIGKSCIHPSQIALANSVYQPTDAEIAHAQRVLQAAQQADAGAVGAYVVDGKMVDRPFVLRAQAIVASARASGLVSN
ncbi:CoA ester lyase [Alicycliphilus denitrificans]|uniref:Citryl-CoA lyase n=2 Tax=Alicycliphilus denitrificans TaxID=179636 RepID=F4G569_ALIDK|nr:CoA ester lyase [Alicycliphilus denitrificans]ADV01457.1 Citryl-CoA lyase [Alicycliphilus denitrificans BC]AEB86415.1 Citryl-CoA lyase [Alicycliphilus denitrificans K601]QKD45522.1 CoA ester lyase [Alicycliphilus denitrificans]